MPQLIASVEGVEIKSVFLQKDRTTLGRGADNDIVFDNMVVSGHHCVFELRGLAEVFIEDLHSTNGTYINGQMVKRQRLHDGEVIAIGNFRIQYLAASERPSGFSGMETAAMKLDSQGTPAKAHAIFQVLNGSSALKMPLTRRAPRRTVSGIKTPDDPTQLRPAPTDSECRTWSESHRPG